MSHAYGQVKFEDGTILHYEYDGTVDVIRNPLWKTVEELTEHWRNQPIWKECHCGQDEPVEIAAYFGNGFWWAGRACKKCMVITNGFRPWWFTPEEQSEQHGDSEKLPEWWLQ